MCIVARLFYAFKMVFWFYLLPPLLHESFQILSSDPPLLSDTEGWDLFIMYKVEHQVLADLQDLLALF